MEERYVSLTVVFDYRATRRAYLEIRDARASDPHVDNRAWRHRIAPGGRRYPHGFSAQKRTISSSGPDFFYTGRNPGSLHLLQAEYSSSPALTSHLDGRVTSRAACNDAKLQETPLRTKLRSSLIGVIPRLRGRVACISVSNHKNGRPRRDRAFGQANQCAQLLR